MSLGRVRWDFLWVRGYTIVNPPTRRVSTQESESLNLGGLSFKSEFKSESESKPEVEFESELF